jgi:hypothetical protein
VGDHVTYDELNRIMALRNTRIRQMIAHEVRTVVHEELAPISRSVADLTRILNGPDGPDARELAPGALATLVRVAGRVDALERREEARATTTAVNRRWIAAVAVVAGAVGGGTGLAAQAVAAALGG